MTGRRRWIALRFAAGVAIAGAVAVGAAAQFELPPGPNRDLVYGQCRTCHDLQYLVDSAGIPREEWDAAIDNMRQYGLRVPPDIRQKVLDYLATYLGPNPPKATAAAPPVPAGDVSGEALFNEQCIACHQANGRGVAGQFPPLAGNRDLFLPHGFAALVVLFGLEGPLDVNGLRFESVMPPFGHLSDQQIATLVRYVQSAWGNAALQPKDATSVDAAAVAQLRKKEMAPAAVLALRRALK